MALFAHIAGLPVEELIVPAVAWISAIWLAVRVRLAARTRLWLFRHGGRR